MPVIELAGWLVWTNVTDASGTAAELVHHQNGRGQRATRE
jgi:hypothetical protein